MKEKYEKPVIETMRVDLNECIASSGPDGVNVNQGQTNHSIMNPSPADIEWGEAFDYTVRQ